ncbi:MAG: exported protein of unknown function [Nitrospira sp.]|jgi:hypothetical protein|nr:exported protein of unknown function [Nitrospira sp.]
MYRRCTRVLVLCFTLIVLAGGCRTGAQLDVMILESAQGAVYLERIPTRQFQATHPIRLPPELIAQSLQGVLIREAKGLLQTFSKNQKPMVPAFSPGDIAFLAPAIANGLSQAAADQQVAFHVAQAGEAGFRERAGAGIGSSESPPHPIPEDRTAGKLFVYGRSLYVTLHQFRYRAERADNVSMPNRRLPEPTGLRNRTVLFMPESALRPDIYAPAFAADEGFTTLVIDYDALAKFPAQSMELQSAPQPGAAQSQPSQTNTPTSPPLKDDVREIKEHMKRKEREVEELRKELQDIKRQLGVPQTNRSRKP